MSGIPIVFIHGAWLHARSWERWEERFAGAGYITCSPLWPGEAESARHARENTGPLPDLGLDELTEHFVAVVRSFGTAPVLVGHSVGGLVAQHLIGYNLGRAAVAIASAPINDIAQGFRAPACAESSGVPGLPSVGFFRDIIANTVSENEASQLYDRYVMPTPSRLLADLGCGDSPRHPSARVDVGNTARGPLLLMSGQEDLLVPDHVTRSAYKAYGDSTALTDLKQFPDRGHSLVIDSGWQPVADQVLDWLGRRGIDPAGRRQG